MKRLLLLFIMIVNIPLLRSQSETKIESHDSKIVLNIWSSEEKPAATVLVVPGWGGGPSDVLGIGKALSTKDITVVIITPRGWHNSEGTASFANALIDIGATLNWIRKSKRSDINSTNIILGGHSWGGGMCLVYAARDTSIKRIFSIAGTDHGILIRKFQEDKEFAKMVRKILNSTSAPNGQIHFDVESSLSELKENQQIYGIQENAENLVDKSIIVFGGWEDEHTTIDDFLLPNYRALKAAGVNDLTFKTYHDNHGFKNVRDQIYSDLLTWINR